MCTLVSVNSRERVLSRAGVFNSVYEVLVLLSETELPQAL